MVNHVRTLLLNDGPAAASAVWPGEEHVPATFRRRVVPDVARPAYDALFPPQSDRTFRTVRLAQCLRLLHRPDTAGLVLSYDPRVTYLPFAAAIFAAVRQGVTVRTLAGTAVLAVEPYPGTADRTRLATTWRVEVVSSTVVRLTGFDPVTAATGSQDVAYTTAAGLSSLVPLPDGTIAVRFPPTVGAAWQVSTLTPPPPLADTLAVVDLAGTAALFVGGGPVRAAAGRIWAESPHLVDRFAAVLLGVAAALEDALPGGGA